MFDAIYDRDSNQSPAAQLQDRLCEALTCLETTDHYLRMLGSVLDERADTQDQHRAGRRPGGPGRAAVLDASAGLEDGNPPARPATQNPIPTSHIRKGYVACFTLSARRWTA